MGVMGKRHENEEAHQTAVFAVNFEPVRIGRQTDAKSLVVFGEMEIGSSIAAFEKANLFLDAQGRAGKRRPQHVCSMRSSNAMPRLAKRWPNALVFRIRSERRVERFLARIE